jgi:hypothetical protein
MDLLGLAYFCKKNYMKFNILLLAALIFASCNNQTNDNTKKEQNTGEQPKEVKIGNRIITKNALVGTYMGELPCDDCKGIKSVLTLGGSNRANYTERKISIGKRDASKIVDGTWSISADSTLITVTSRGDSNEKIYFKKEGKNLIAMASASEAKKCETGNCVLIKTESTPINARDVIRNAKEQAKDTKEVNGTLQKVESTKK